MNPGEIYTAPDGRKYRAEGTEEWACVGCDLLHDDVYCNFIVCTDPNIHFKRITKDDAITYSLIESLRTGKSWPGGMPDSNSFHEGAKAMARHLGYEIEGHAKETE